MAGTENPNIKILISCHKEAPHPQSDVFLPVQVGAANAARRFEGMQPDDEGENISDRNFTFCELTAQYWAWKNLDADYYGLCHSGDTSALMASSIPRTITFKLKKTLCRRSLCAITG